MSQSDMAVSGFEAMNLKPAVFSVLQTVGYQSPTPIQTLAVGPLMAGRDLLGQARTGTGKTAAFALPLLSRIDIRNKRPQILVLTPTRELAIQVAASFETYGANLKGLNVLAVYGGQSYGVQLNRLKKGVHVVVGTPGRLMDHLRRKTITLADLFCTILDEADEMLHMGFIEDVEWILEQTPPDVQTALFSATMPGAIRKIARKYLNQAEEILIEPEKKEIGTINQKYWFVRGTSKIEALARILSGTTHDGVIVFTRTKAATLDVAKALEEKGFNADALNGDLAQAARERTIQQLKSGRIDILVATDVAARGLDVDRISHVINYDMPSRVEPYIHRIGRTGRAGRTGEAILFVSRKERWMVRVIEKTTRQKISEINLPSQEEINRRQIEGFLAGITKTILSEDLSSFEAMIRKYAETQEVSMTTVAAALARMAGANATLPLPVEKGKAAAPKAEKRRSTIAGSPVETGGPVSVRVDKASEKRSDGRKNAVSERPELAKKRSRPVKNEPLPPVEQGMERYRIEVGKNHGVRPGNIVGAISNESGLESRFIGRIDIGPDFSLVDLPFGMPRQIFNILKKTRVASRQMAISKCA